MIISDITFSSLTKVDNNYSIRCKKSKVNPFYDY